METGVLLTVFADSDYRFEVEVSDELSVRYCEVGRELPVVIGFGSLEEMEAVANAMLKAVRIARDG